MTVGERIGMLSYQHDYSLRKLAELAGVSYNTICAWESGRVSKIPHTAIIRLADIFGITPNELLGWDEKNDKRTR